MWLIISVFVFLFCAVCGSFTHSRGADPSSYGHSPGWSHPPLGRVRPRGRGLSFGSLDTPMSSTLALFGLVFVFGSHGPSGPSFVQKGGLGAPPGPFHMHVCLSMPQNFVFAGLRGPDWIARRCCSKWNSYSKSGVSNSKSCSENTPDLSESS